MKIINIDRTVAADDLLRLLQQKLNPLFHRQRQSDIDFIIKNNNGVIEISQPEIYEGFLFKIAIKRQELHITRSEHYVDDVNSLTIESILNALFEELAANGKITLILEG